MTGPVSSDALFKLVQSSSVPVNKHQVIREILGGFSWGGWTFPAQATGDGCMGITTISASRIMSVPVVPAADVLDQLALHVIFEISCKGMTKASGTTPATFKIKLAKLHLTARPKKTQVLISCDGSSILTAAASIHCGAGNDWDWRGENARELCTKLGPPTVADVQTALQNNGFSPGHTYMTNVKNLLPTAIVAHATTRYPSITFDVVEKDKSWT